MNITHYAGILGLVAAALLAVRMLMGAHPTPSHRGDPRHTAPTTETGPARHRATSPGKLRRILR